jgi:hypothetical protein
VIICNEQGAFVIGAEFKVGMLGFNYAYSLLLKSSPEHGTVTWTLDYSRKSDLGMQIY